MKTLLAALLFALPAFAQIHVDVSLPSILFPAPPHLVVVEPGVQVVENYDEEVFFVDNFYWHHRGPHWYRTNAHNGAWVLVEPRFVPERIAIYEPGRFRRWRGSEPERREWNEWHERRNREHREERREERREDRHERREDRREQGGFVHGSTPVPMPPPGVVHGASPVGPPPGKNNKKVKGH
jgi:hypothetical protein